MQQNTEHLFRGRITSKHIVQLFDTPDTLADGVASFLLDGLRASDRVLVVARPAHWSAIGDRLEQQGCPIAGAAATGQLTVRDAADTLAAFMRNGQPVAKLFRSIVGGMIENLEARGGGLRIYGEMVDVLAEERNFSAARALEELWNELGMRHSFTLLCGYSSAHFADASTARMLVEICNLHTHAHAAPDDVMGSWVLGRTTVDATNSVEQSGKV